MTTLEWISRDDWRESAEAREVYNHHVDILEFRSKWNRPDRNGEDDMERYPWWDWLQAVAQHGTILSYWEWAYERYQDDYLNDRLPEEKDAKDDVLWV